MSDAAPFEILQLSEAERSAFLERVRPAVSAADYRLIEGMSRAVPEVLSLLEQKDMTLGRLRRILFGSTTEKTSAVFPPPAPPPAQPSAPPAKPRRRGHGRRGAQAYTGALRVVVRHPSLQRGDLCPACQRGRLHRVSQPGILLRIVAAPPISATVYELEKLRCCLCGQLFSPPPPPDAGLQKYDPSVSVIVAVLRYGTGVPMYRLEAFQQSLGVPLPASTQWELVEELAHTAEFALGALRLQAACASLVHNDDTTLRIASLRLEPTPPDADDPVPPGRTGTFTTSLVAEVGDHRIALFVTGWRHAGENLDALLGSRPEQLPPPAQMCDALSRNEPKEFATILGHCVAHARRLFVDAAPNFPDECRHVLETLREVYRLDAQAKDDRLNPDQRLAFHQTQSRPVLDGLHRWLKEQTEQKKVEPNSGLGQAIGYLLRHWEPLTLFLRHPGVPLDNNICYAARGITDIMPTAGLCRVEVGTLAFPRQREISVMAHAA